MILSTSAVERTPISGINTNRALGSPGDDIPAGASVVRPPANWRVVVQICGMRTCVSGALH